MKGDLMGTVQGSESRVPLAGVIKDVSSVNQWHLRKFVLDYSRSEVWERISFYSGRGLLSAEGSDGEDPDQG